MLERSPRHREIQISFRSLAEKILAREGAIVVETGWKNKTGKAQAATADFVFKRPPENELTVVEAKLCRTRRMDDGLFRNALEEIRRHRDAKKAKNAILIMTADASPAQSLEAEKQGVAVWGIPQLVPLAIKTPTLAEALADLLREISSDPHHFADPMQTLEANTARAKARGEGAKLIAELDQSKPGRENHRKFEQIGEKAVRLLFSEQVQRWSVPVIMEDGLNRPTLVVRLAPRHDVWQSLSTEFSSRYMIFSFQNEAEPAGYGDVTAASRHLHPKARRSVGILVARGGFEQGARRAAVETLRDHGKLVLLVSLQELKEMLIARDAGDEYHDFFHERASDLMADNLV